MNKAIAARKGGASRSFSIPYQQPKATSAVTAGTGHK